MNYTHQDIFRNLKKSGVFLNVVRWKYLVWFWSQWVTWHERYWRRKGQIKNLKNLKTEKGPKLSNLNVKLNDTQILKTIKELTPVLWFLFSHMLAASWLCITKLSKAAKLTSLLLHLASFLNGLICFCYLFKDKFTTPSGSFMTVVAGLLSPLKPVKKGETRTCVMKKVRDKTLM